MNIEELESFVEGFNGTFGKPFLPKGFASAKITEGNTLRVEIGDRNCEFDLSLEVCSRGAYKRPTEREWFISQSDS